MPSRLKKNDLKYHKPQIQALHTSINDILILIDEKIKIAYNQGSNSINFPLSGTFDIPKMSSYDARNKIHFSIISDLTCEERGFQVQYVKTKAGRYVLTIKWKTLEDVYKKENEIGLLQFYAMSISQQEQCEDKPESTKYEGMLAFRY